ncbi:MAG: lamin tail domain-containing protein [Minisyncoccia bacterium]
MTKTPLFFKYLILIFIFFPFNFLLAYDANTTHPYLTNLTIDYYNKIFPFREINNQEKEWLKEGSIKEDEGIRSINHFYDPVYNTTYKIYGVENILPALTAKEWSQNQLVQALYDSKYLASLSLITKSPVFSEANRTWQRAIYEYVKGNKKEAFISLGHILHLIQDMSVPEHTRANIHIYFLPNAESYFELYTARSDDSFYQKIKESLKNRTDKIMKDSLNDYFDFLANYSNNNFYSPDTIDNLKYKLPEVAFYDVIEKNEKTNELETFLMGIDENKQLYHLAQKKVFSWRWQEGFTNYTLANEKVLKDYWERLPLKAILTGAGVIDLFFKETEKAKINPNFISLSEKNLLLAFWGGIQNLLKSISLKGSDYILIDSNDKDFSNLQSNSNSSFFDSLTNSASNIKAQNQEKTQTSLASDFGSYSSTTFSKTESTSFQAKSCQFQDGNNKKPLREKIIFNEINWMGSFNSPNDEWIEIKNISSSTIDLSGWQIIDQDEKIHFTFPNGTKISPFGLILLERSSDEAVPFIKADFIYSGALNNINEGLRLFNSSCGLEDEVLANPEWPAGDNNSKRTMERVSDFSWFTYSGDSNNGLYGTPKKENSLKKNLEIPNNSTTTLSPTTTTTTKGASSSIINTPTTTAITTTTTKPSITTTTTTTTMPKQILLINEIQFAGKNDEGVNAYEEFIELYNPNPFAVDLTGWYLQRKTASGSSYSSLVPANLLEGRSIPAFGYFLITHSSSSYSSFAQVTTNYTITENNTIVLKNPNREIIDKVGYGNASDCEGECALNFEPGQSIQRKFVNNTFLDTDNNLNDFEILNCPSPLAQEQQNCYVSENGSENNFENNSENNSENHQEDILKSPESNSEIDTESLKDSFPLKNISWHPLDENKSKIVLEFDIEKYPFIENTDLTNNMYFALVFFFNEDDLKKIPDLLFQDNYWQIKDLEVLDFSYPNCQGLTTPLPGIYFTSQESNCFSIGVPRGYAFLFNQLPKDNHFLVEVQGTNFQQNKSFQKEDFLTIGIYSFMPYSNSSLKLINYSSEKYYFQEDFYYHLPSKVNDFKVTFDKENSSLIFSWSKAEDEDKNDHLLYDIRYTLKKSDDNLFNNDLIRLPWQSLTPLNLSSCYRYSFNPQTEKFEMAFPLKDLPNFNPIICEPTTLYFAIKSQDQYGFYSEISDVQEISLLPESQEFSSINDFIENLKWFFNEDGKMILEFDLTKRYECLKDYKYFVIKTGWDFEPGLIFLNSDATSWNLEKNRAGGRFQNSGDKLLVSNYPPSLGHFKIEMNNFYHPLINNGSPINNFNKEILAEELKKVGKSLEDIYLIVAFGASKLNYQQWFFYNLSTFNQPEVFKLSP